MPVNKKLNSGILEGVGYEIDVWLNSFLPRGWKKGCAPHFSNKSTYLELLKAGTNQADHFSGLIHSIDVRIRRNLDSVKPRPPSLRNWRFEGRCKIDPNNKSPEVCLERAIVGLEREEWGNQSPVASGLLSATSDKGRHVDLVREVERDAVYEMIELKWHSDNPFFAAMEIICYSLVYLLFRDKFPQIQSPLLKASAIRLRVLAPSEYYRHDGSKQFLPKLQSQISAAIETFAGKGGVTIDFRFWEIQNCPNPKDVSPLRLKDVAEIIMSVARTSELPSP